MDNELIPYFEPGKRVTGEATAAVTGKRFVVISGDRTADGSFSVARAGAAASVFGVAVYDAAIGVKVPIVKGGVIPVTSGAAIAANAEVQSDSTGRAVTLAGGVAIGRCLDGVGAADLDVMIDLYNGGAAAVPASNVVGDQAAVVPLTNSTGQAGDDVVANVPDVAAAAAAATAIAAAAATAVTDAMLTDGTVDAAGVNAELATLAADIITKAEAAIDTALDAATLDVITKVNAVVTIAEANIADLTDKVNELIERLETSGLLTA